ncbi:hypothetical protein KL918_004249 [Ogataea parapolymorpha]|nr:hypothetical protein KL918_004249 [Ogataea parapolymorpha]KAG7872111.1 hypothetical protein KL916_003449 [Ogataea parapolymorpha]
MGDVARATDVFVSSEEDCDSTVMCEVGGLVVSPIGGSIGGSTLRSTLRFKSLAASGSLEPDVVLTEFVLAVCGVCDLELVVVALAFGADKRDDLRARAKSLAWAHAGGESQETGFMGNFHDA